MTINEQIIYYYEHGWRLKDIACKVGITTIAVKSRLQRIRQKQEVKRPWER